MTGNVSDGLAEEGSRMTQANGRAVWFRAAREVEVRDAAVASPAAGEVTVEGVCSLISPGTEMLVYRGQIRPDQPTGVPTVEGSFGFPVKYGYQVVGRVVEAGPDAGLAPGRLVFVRHPHQTRLTMPVADGAVTAVPAGVTPVAASFANLVDVAVNCMLDAPIRFGDVVAVHGLGFVGLFCAQLATRTADAVVAIDPDPFRRELAVRRGIPHVVAPGDAPALLAELSDGRGADVAIEASGSAAGLQAAILTTGQEGTIAVVAFYGAKHLDLQLGDAFHFRRQRLVSSNVVRVAGELQPRWTRQRRFACTLSLLSSLDLEPLVTHRFAFEAAAEAYGLVDTGAPGTLGVLLEHPQDAS